MKISQNVRHFASRTALTLPVVGSLVTDKLVDLHTRVFVEKADEDAREERREHLDDFFEATMDTYLAAVRAGFTEAAAREITHVQANFDFYNHGWVEMMEFPTDEVTAHYERYEAFFQRHGITVDDPLGEFRPAEGVTSAPSTPEKLDSPDHPHAAAGFADDVYVDTGEEIVAGGIHEPADVELTDAPGVGPEDVPDREETS